MEYRFGIEEEFFVVGADTLQLMSDSDAQFLGHANLLAGGGINCELLQCQIETSTPVCGHLDEAEFHLRRLRRSLVLAGKERGIAVIAAGTHPTGDWPRQLRSNKARYQEIERELQMLAFRNLVCGAHVHVELEDNDGRIDVMRRCTPFLPILLALSCSSPFWRSMQTGFSSYRLTAYDELPRTGLPPIFADWSEYAQFVSALQAADVIADPSFIWWAVRPSHNYPTIELRIADACTNVGVTLAVAGLFRSIVRLLVMEPEINADFAAPDRALAKENKWRIQRFGLDADLINPFERGRPMQARQAARRLVDLVLPHAAALGCLDLADRIEDILACGTSAERQLGVYRRSIDCGLPEAAALNEVVEWLRSETAADTSTEAHEAV
jgi:carboxylate-amine ligase